MPSNLVFTLSSRFAALYPDRPILGSHSVVRSDDSHHGIRRVKRPNLTRGLTAMMLPELDLLRTRLTHRPAKDAFPPAVEL